MKEITFELTDYCMFKCRYCSSETTLDMRKAKFIKITEIKKRLKKEGKFDRINISGGEPLAHPNFFNIYMLCEEYADDVAVYSNLWKHRRYNANKIDGVYLEANLTIPMETKKLHVLKRVNQGREKTRPEVKISNNFRIDCSCDHRVIKPDGTVTLTPCNKSISKKINNIKIYVSGSHGVGKTTLIKDINEILNMQYYENESNNPYKKDIKKRQLWRLLKYYNDEKILNNMEGKIFINRCCIDWLIYTKVFKKLKWINENDYIFLINKYESLFKNNIPDHVVYLNPDIEWSKERIIERWKKQNMKWKENDFHYYDLIRQEYDNTMNDLKKITKIIEIKEIEKMKRIVEIESTC